MLIHTNKNITYCKAKRKDFFAILIKMYNFLGKSNFVDLTSPGTEVKKQPEENEKQHIVRNHTDPGGDEA